MVKKCFKFLINIDFLFITYYIEYFIYIIFPHKIRKIIENIFINILVQ